MVVYLNWSSPDSKLGYTHTKVYWTTTPSDSGSWAEFTSSNSADYGANGIAISQCYTRDVSGTDGRYYRVRYYDSSTGAYSDYSDNLRTFSFRGYCTIDDVRDFINVQDTEYSDNAIQLMIDAVTTRIDQMTGRTWQGTVSSGTLYLDSDKGKTFYLPNSDVTEITTLEIDDDLDGDFTAITTSYVDLYGGLGMIALDSGRHSSIEVTSFPGGRKCVKVVYNYGKSAPTNDVRLLAVLMTSQMIKLDETRQYIIDSLLRPLRRLCIDTV